MIHSLEYTIPHKPAWKLRGYKKRKLIFKDLIKIWFINILDKHQL
jgi:hypothetical protein